MGLFPKSLHAVSALGFALKVALFVLAYSFDCYFKFAGTLWVTTGGPDRAMMRSRLGRSRTCHVIPALGRLRTLYGALDGFEAQSQPQSLGDFQ